MQLRNVLYDHGIKKSKAYDLPVIAVGNLSVGGTGKSPMIEYLIGLLKDSYWVASLSRGYKRSTRGFILLDGSESAKAVGDEPLQFKHKFPEVRVAVDENRRHGIEALLRTKPRPEVILLDDAYQHRKVRAGYYILLTAYADRYTKDLILPAGNLREPRAGAARADVVVVTKCPPELSLKARQEIVRELDLEEHQKVFFSYIGYGEWIRNAEQSIRIEEWKDASFTLVTGIARPGPLVEFLKEKGLSFTHKAFPDHHNFSDAELKELRSHGRILTTEKDYMRLKAALAPGQLYYLPIRTRFLNEEQAFASGIREYVQASYR